MINKFDVYTRTHICVLNKSINKVNEQTILSNGKLIE